MVGRKCKIVYTAHIIFQRAAQWLGPELRLLRTGTWNRSEGLLSEKGTASYLESLLYLLFSLLT